MKDQIQQIFGSGLSFSVIDGRLKVVGVSEIIETFRPLLKEYRNEIIAILQAAGELKNSPAMPEHAGSKTNAAQAMLAQQSGNETERLSAWARGELVEIPHAAKMLDIYRALELEHRAKQIGKPEFVEELSRAIVTIDHISREQRPDDFHFALSVLRSATEDAAVLLPSNQETAA